MNTKIIIRCHVYMYDVLVCSGSGQLVTLQNQSIMFSKERTGSMDQVSAVKDDTSQDNRPPVLSRDEMEHAQLEQLNGAGILNNANAHTDTLTFCRSPLLSLALLLQTSSEHEPRKPAA